jgi:hypothetical protein
MADMQTIADYIYRRAVDRGVDPNLALGIASREGLNERTLNSPTFGNVDTRGYSFGPFQLFSGSRDPRRIAPGGMAYEFQQRFGAPPSRENWQQQVDFSIDRMRTGVTPWHAVRNAGGVEPITQIGREAATRFGLGVPGTPTYQGAEANPGSPTMPVAPGSVQALTFGSPGYQGAEANPGNTTMPQPVYARDIGTSLRRLGNYVAPDLVDPATPLTPEQIAQQKEEDAKNAARLASAGSAQRSFLQLQSLSQPQQMQQPDLRAQVMGPRQFQPIQPLQPFQRRRGLLD